MKQKDVGRGISPLLGMQHLSVTSQLKAICAGSETALQGPADVFKILTEINCNGFPGEREKARGREMAQVNLKQMEMGLGKGGRG